MFTAMPAVISGIFAFCEIFQADLRPCFELIELFDQLRKRGEPRVDHRLFAGLNFGIVEFENVDDSEVYFADFGFVVIDESDAVFGPPAFDIDFFFQFAAHAFDVGGLFFGEVGGGHVSADSDGAFGVQSCFTLRGASLVVEQLIFEAEDAVGDELFEGGVQFHLRSGVVAGVSGVEDDVEVAIDVAAEALEVSDFVKDLCGDDQHMLNAHGSCTLFREFQGAVLSVAGVLLTTTS